MYQIVKYIIPHFPNVQKKKKKKKEERNPSSDKERNYYASDQWSHSSREFNNRYLHLPSSIHIQLVTIYSTPPPLWRVIHWHLTTLTLSKS